MTTYDAEDLLASILAIMVDGGALNAKVAAIDAEKTAAGKALTPALAPFASDAYYEQSWSNKILNNSPGIFYGIEDVQAQDGGGGVVAKIYKVFVEVVYCDSGQTNDAHKRINRYARALEELFAAAYAPALGHGTVKMEAVRPMAFKLALDSDEEIKVGGISLTISLV
jgi:hypothetical protein